jgi:hypothetical protein
MQIFLLFFHFRPMVKPLKVNMLLAVLSVLGLAPVFSSPTTHIKLFVVANASAILMLVSKKKIFA